MNANLSTESGREGKILKSLAGDLYPSVCLVNGKVHVYGPGSPVVLECDPVSVDKLFNNRADFSRIELIRITLESREDEVMNLDLSRLQGFENLKYILLVFGYDACGMKNEACLKGKAGNMVHGTRPEVEILYVLSIPE